MDARQEKKLPEMQQQPFYTMAQNIDISNFVLISFYSHATPWNSRQTIQG
jgi:hypothetical protein